MTILLSALLGFWFWTNTFFALATSNLESPVNLEENLEGRGFRDGLTLRILTVGASIVYGYNSPDGNGFRYALRNQLVYNGNPVNMIGSVSSGTMADNQCEGWGGFVIDQMYDKVVLDLSQRPNLILLHVGTNDMGQNLDVDNAHVRLRALIEWMFSQLPGVTIIASTLLPNGNNDTMLRVSAFNAKIPNMVIQLQALGRNITYVDFSSSWYSLADISSDGIHPTAGGYQKMAKTWYDGIAVAAGAGMMLPPQTVAGVDDFTYATTTCDKIQGNAYGPFQIQRGSGSDDGPYAHTGVNVGGFSGFSNPAYVGFNNPLPEGVYWADINGDGIDDYVYIAANANGGFGVALSLGGGAFGEYLYFTFDFFCLRRGVRFADMTGDGRDDYCCLSPAGDLDCWQNTPGPDPRSPIWVEMGRVKNNEGYGQSQVRLADIDGDGRADYCVINITDDTWSIWGWHNGAVANVAPQNWLPLGGVIKGLLPRTLSGYRFVDLNGDHKDDLVWVDENGAVETWINQRGWATGGWTPVFQYMGVTHGGAGPNNPRNVTFGAFMGSGRADYSTVTLVPNANFAIQNVYVDRYRNDDHGGTQVKADGTRYCDMRGSGSDDFVYLSAEGEVTVLENNHQWNTSISPWNYIGVVYATGRPRAEIHLADFTGDGKCDILLVDRGTGATRMVRNDWVNGHYAFTDVGIVTGTAQCHEGYGWDRHDIGVRWNDINGDGRADFLCMQSDGIITGYLNQGIGVMIYQGQIKNTEGRERKNLRLADIDGDGRDDLVWLDPRTGQMQMWKNMGPSSSAIPSVDPASAFGWLDKGWVAPGGANRGSAVEFGNIYGIGRADYITITAQTNVAYVMFNLCPGGGLVAVTPTPPSGAPNAPCYPLATCNQPTQVPTPPTTTTAVGL